MLALDLFEEVGCKVIEAGSAAEALAQLEERPDVSLMFTGFRMPGMSGPELAEIAAQRSPPPANGQAIQSELLLPYANTRE